ncbi:GFA family protein [Sphingomonas sp. BT-65]|uniref:GFA family protein n=1 Tax=Sphingomonas sp. BT-65 TaxID=2989821 RepID=UPI002235C812|nr:GFA family protein [Sphingomonas sp. BT-65]MCW4463119.1 GFA family protein [Sphingomonas sp. BT-65]
MTEPYTGGCACGAIRYQVSSEPAMMNLCQCRQCQRDSGTGHAAHVTFVGAQVETSGQPSFWEMVGEGGTRKHRAFCPTCGSPVYIAFPDMPEVFVASAGSLDDPSRYHPQVVLWTAARQAWDHLDPALTAFDKMPPM